MKTLCGLYDDPETAQRAFEALGGAGLSVKDVAVISSDPLEVYAFGRDEGRTWMPWLAALGGAAGGTFGFWLTATTQTLWPLQTGGMPIVTMWTNGIITFELTMLGAILATLVTFLASAIFPGRRPALSDPAVSEGKILICVTNPRARSLEELARLLHEIGGAEVKEIDLKPPPTT